MSYNDMIMLIIDIVVTSNISTILAFIAVLAVIAFMLKD